jgi:hypothetical protein
VPHFLPVPVGGRALAGHDEAVLTVQSPGDGCEFWVMMKQSRWRAKNNAPARLPSPKAGLAGNPIDSVSAAGTVRVPQNLISGYDFTLIDFGVDYGVVRATGRVPRSLCHAITNLSRLTGEAGRQLIKPTELYAVLFFSQGKGILYK